MENVTRIVSIVTKSFPGRDRSRSGERDQHAYPGKLSGQKKSADTMGDQTNYLTSQLFFAFVPQKSN